MRNLFHFEKRGQALAPKEKFRSRLAFNIAAGSLTVALALAIGMAGYGYFAQMSPVDAFLNSAMILSGMGPMGGLKSVGRKIFAGSYAIFSGLLIVIATGFVLAPMFHRVLHKFHVEEKGDE